MNAFSRTLLRLARWIAGRRRREWAEAMASEAEALTGDSRAWALGCVWASVKDRTARDWSFALAILVLPALTFVWKGSVFFWTSSLLVDHRIAAWLAVAFWILSPFPIAFLLGHMRRGRSLYIALGVVFALAEFAPFLIMWIKAGLSPITFFSAPHVNWYKADPNVRIGPPAGITLDLLVWLAGAWLGSHWRRPTRRSPATD